VPTRAFLDPEPCPGRPCKQRQQEHQALNQYMNGLRKKCDSMHELQSTANPDRAHCGAGTYPLGNALSARWKQLAVGNASGEPSQRFARGRAMALVEELQASGVVVPLAGYLPLLLLVSSGPRCCILISIRQHRWNEIWRLVCLWHLAQAEGRSRR